MVKQAFWQGTKVSKNPLSFCKNDVLSIPNRIDILESG